MEITDKMFNRIMDMVEGFYYQAQDKNPPDYFKPTADLITMTEEQRAEHKLEFQMTYAEANTLNVLHVADRVADILAGMPEEPDYDGEKVNGNEIAKSCVVMELNKEGFCVNCGQHYEDHEK